MRCIDKGHSIRATCATNINEHSSRSHLVVSLSIRGECAQDKSTLSARLHMIDLAGSENIKKSLAEGDSQKESIHINKSLSALIDVFNALALRQAHVPWRNSKLTYLLQDSLGGDAKVMVLAHISPLFKDFGESWNTLCLASKFSKVEKGSAKCHIKKK